MSEKYYTVQDKINGAFSTVNESDYKPYDPASGGSSFDPSVLEPYAEIENVDASLALKADKTELQNYTLYSDYEQTTDAVSALQNSIANVYTQAEVDDRINRIPKFNIAVISVQLLYILRRSVMKPVICMLNIYTSMTHGRNLVSRV